MMKAKTKSIFFLILMFLLYSVGLGTIGIIVFFSIDNDSLHLGAIIAYIVFTIPFLYILFKKTRIHLFSPATEHASTNFPWLRLLCIAIALFAIGEVYARLFSPYPTTAHETSVVNIIIDALSNLLFAPILEELFYRKWMITYLERARVKPIYILLITSFLFFIAHIEFFHWYFRCETFLFGVVMNYIYTKYRDVRCCKFVHFINNLLAVVLSYIG